MKLPKGITRDGAGYRAFVRVHAGPGGLRSKRFGLEATVTEMRAWREAERVAYRQQRGLAGPVSNGTLDADIVKYLQLVATMPSIKDRRRDLAAWSDVLGTKARAKITRDDVRLALQTWRLGDPERHVKPLSASTCNHRRTALMHLFRILDGRGAPNPVRDVAPFREPDPEPRAVPLAVVAAILDGMRPSKTRARLKVLAWTGLRGRSELEHVRPEHVNLAERRCWVRTGKKGKPRELVLNAKGVAAWREFIKMQAWGPYHKDSLRHAWERALAEENARRLETAKKARRPPDLLPKIRVYDLRHSIATALITAGADLADVQAHLGHTSPRMTRRYAPYQPEKLARAMGRVR